MNEAILSRIGDILTHAGEMLKAKGAGAQLVELGSIQKAIWDIECEFHSLKQNPEKEGT